MTTTTTYESGWHSFKWIYDGKMLRRLYIDGIEKDLHEIDDSERFR